MPTQIVVLTEGHSNPLTAKTAASVIRYRRGEVVAVFDRSQVGKTAQELLHVGGDLPVIGALADAPTADTLLIGIAPAGGKIPAAWKAVILEAIERGMHIVSGLHDFLTDDPDLVSAAARRGVTISDVRKNDEKEIAHRLGLRQGCLRVHTVGADCNVGKMVTAIEVTRGLRQRGRSAKFVATGQTGIMIEGDGCPIDRVISDFVNGAAEKLVLERQDHDFLLIEGQGSLAHPAYSAVTLGLLHGCCPQALIFCYEAGRTRVRGIEHVPLPSLAEFKRLYELMANLAHPCEIIGFSMNSRLLAPEQAEQERARVRAEFGLPVCDVIRHGPDELVEAVLAFDARRPKV